MKKTYFKTMVILMAVALATGVTSCDKDEDEDANLFTPASNLSNSEIKVLLNEAMENTLAVSAFSVTGEEGDDDEDGGDNATYSIAVNRNTKKALYSVFYEGGRGFTYIEDTDAYFYDKDGEYEAYMYKTSYPSFENALNAIIIEDLTLETEGYEWKVSGNKLIGTEVVKGDTYQATITLTSDKKLFRTDYRELDANHDYGIQTYSYGETNPAFPAGFNKEDFK